MSGKSRLSYHGVSRIIPNDIPYWLRESLLTDGDSTCDAPANEETEQPANKKARQDEFSQQSPTTARLESTTCGVCACEGQSRIKEEFLRVIKSWDDSLVNYISKCRINLNVRQVLFPGELKLPSRNSD